MFALAILGPSLVVAALVWALIGFRRRRGEVFNRVTATAFYARVMVVAGSVAAFAGIAVLFKLGISMVSPAYSYYQFVPTEFDLEMGRVAGPSIPTQQAQDLTLAVSLVGVGILVAVGHEFLARHLKHRPGGLATWIERGSVVVLTVVSGVAALVSVAVLLLSAVAVFYIVQMVNFGNVPEGANLTFGGALGTMLVFSPVFLMSISRLLLWPHPRQGGLIPPRALTSGV